MNSYLLSIFTLFTCIKLIGQTDFFQAQNIIVTKNGINLKNPWAGGINVPQLSPIDLNGDNLLDLVIFDKNGDQLNCFINNGLEGEVDYHYSPEYNIKFPIIEDWILLRDFNCDNKMDIFTSFNGGIIVYKNSGIANQLSFEFVQKILTNRGSGNTDLYVSSVDIPHIGDLDQDGDLDILTFSVLGNHVEWHKNNSIEYYGHCDSLNFVLEDDCWGDFSENFSNNSVTLNDCENLRMSKENFKHSGSTVTAFDLNGDSFFELLLGDVTFDNLVMLQNSATTESALMVNQDTNFPSNTESVNIPKFPAAYFFDANNDNVKDLIVSPNGNNVSVNHNNIWFYKNESNTSEVNLNLIKKNFLTEEMIEVGSGANPIFFDYNNDQLMDLIVANYGYWIEGGNFNSQLSLYKNIGSSSLPKFEWVTDDYANLGTLNFDNNISPTFGDLDGDNDLDMLVGDANGKLHLFNNIMFNNESNFFIQTTEYFDIDVGSFASPFLIDIDRDGDLDLIIGSRQGQIYYYKNEGTSSEPNFVLINELFGNINLIDPIFNTAYTTPTLIDGEEGYELFVGTEKGSIYHYMNIENNLDGTFQAVDDSILLYSKSIRTNPAVYDLNNDGDNDMLIGTFTGGLHLLWGGIDSTIKLDENTQNKLHIFPNPTDGILHLNYNYKITEVEIYTIEGRLCYVTPFKNIIDLNFLNNGVYFLRAKKKMGGILLNKICIY